ncbi:hypothetical protein Dfri01_64940 [Dyadobacter frigoris]|uniref:hypothetical protein n=1 Tax=Dyadobacter frigoris TaxID=2576211 RepID=UPI0024A57499|nr:hypothetical protein [Dyadobacter frigoris]GLU57033.1 hypothetical protein Dfri01_64940 [Dyadobacter frigoris]
MAKFTERITNWFRSSKDDEEYFYDEEPESPTETPVSFKDTMPQNSLNPSVSKVTANINNPQPEQTPVTPVRTEVVIPYWLEDEDTLRDEGVLFGLSESDPTEKTDIIHKYFSHLAAPHLSSIEQHNERIQEQNLFIGQKTNRIEELENKLKNLVVTKSDGEHHLPRTLIGLSLSVAMCIGNFFLIKESLKPAFAESSWIALGVFLAGMFSLFGRISMFHDTDSKVSWRSLLEEIGLPFAAALFVFANVLPYQGIWQSIALFVFVFFLFLFAGKLFLSNVTILRNDLHALSGIRRDHQETVNNTQNWESEIQSLQHEVDELRVKKWQILREQGQSETERDRIYAKRDMLIKLFESEFSLARRMKNQLTNKQLQDIRKSAE